MATCQTKLPPQRDQPFRPGPVEGLGLGLGRRYHRRWQRQGRLEVPRPICLSRSPISNRKILALKDGQVTFRYHSHHHTPCPAVHRPVPTAHPSTRLPETAHLRPAPSQAAPRVGHCQRATPAPHPSKRPTISRIPFSTTRSLSSNYLCLSQVCLRDDPDLGNPDKARTALMPKSPINLSNCPATASLACPATPNYHPRRVREGLLPCSPPMPVAPIAPSKAQPRHHPPHRFLGRSDSSSPSSMTAPKQILKAFRRSGSIQPRLAGGPLRSACKSYLLYLTYLPFSTMYGTNSPVTSPYSSKVLIPVTPR